VKRPAWLRIDPAELLLEIVSIVLAILLAFALNAWNDARKTQREAHESLVNVRREVAQNRDRLVPVMAPHRRFRAAYATYVRRHDRLDVDEFYKLFISVAPTGLHPFVPETTAWDIARSLPSVTAVPYETRVAIEQTYAEQSFLRGEGEHIGDDLHLSATGDRPNLYLPAIAVLLDSTDLTGSETRVLKLYDDLLKRLPAE
jgi:hypothetical protein